MYQRTCYDSLGSHLILFYGPDFFLTHILFKNILRRLPVVQLWCMIREFSFYWASKQEMIVMRIHVIREWKVLEGRCCLWIERMPCTQTNIFMKFYMKIWWFSFECFLPFNFFQPKDWLPIYIYSKSPLLWSTLFCVTFVKFPRPSEYIVWNYLFRVLAMWCLNVF